MFDSTKKFHNIKLIKEEFVITLTNKEQIYVSGKWADENSPSRTDYFNLDNYKIEDTVYPRSSVFSITKKEVVRKSILVDSKVLSFYLGQGEKYLSSDLSDKELDDLISQGLVKLDEV